MGISGMADGRSGGEKRGEWTTPSAYRSSPVGRSLDKENEACIATTKWFQGSYFFVIGFWSTSQSAFNGRELYRSPASSHVM